MTNSIGNLRPNNSTNVQAGLNLGVGIADRMRNDRPDSYNYVILMSDGVANVDATDPFAILQNGGRPAKQQSAAADNHWRGHRELQ